MSVIVSLNPLKAQFLEDLKVGRDANNRPIAYLDYEHWEGDEVASCRAATRDEVDAAVEVWETEHNYRLDHFDHDPMGS